MNTQIRNIGFTILLSSVFLFCSCGGDAKDDMMNENETPEQGFIINEDTYETPNAYLVFHSTPQYDSETMTDVIKFKDQFSLLFIDGTAIVDDGTILYSTDTNHASYHYFREVGDNGLVDEIQNLDISSGTFVQTPATTTRIDISDLIQTVAVDGTAYGDPVFAGLNYPLTDEDVASLDIKSLTIDYDSLTGSIDCEYSISPSFDGPIIGQYSGTFNILLD